MSSHSGSATRWVLIAVVVVGLAIDAYVHFDLASAFEDHRTSSLSEPELFRFEAVIAIIAAIGVLVRPRRYTVGFAFLVGASAFIIAVIYRYADIGAIGPIPNMYDPYWEPVGKIVTVIAELVVALASIALFSRVGGRPAHHAR